VRSKKINILSVIKNPSVQQHSQ